MRKLNNIHAKLVRDLALAEDPKEVHKLTVKIEKVTIEEDQLETKLLKFEGNEGRL